LAFVTVISTSMHTRHFALITFFAAFCGSALSQPSRITAKIDNAERITLTGHLNPRALAEDDQGRVSPSLAVTYVTVELAKTAGQQADLEQLLANQQNPASPDYQHWLTPEEYGQRFGVSDDDIATLSSWLKAQGLSIAGVARGKTWIAVSGTAAQVESAFQLELHDYLVDGVMHFANATEPSVPAAFSEVIRGLRGLHDFRMKPRSHVSSHAAPKFTDSRTGEHFLAPDDFATIYNVSALYSKNFTGSGQKLVVGGQTQLPLSDIESFRSMYGLSANDPQLLLVPGSQDPGVSQDDLGEADLDVEWSGAVARNATIIYVYSSDALQSIQYAIDQNLAPVVSVSYGLCEQENGNSDTLMLRTWAQQGNAQGITWFAASGDSGAADCGDSQNPGLAVDAPGSVPEVTSVGGTEFMEGSGQFWSSINGATQASAFSYIPEMVWNDSVADGMPSSGGGGASTIFTKPSWQTGPGVPADNARDVPDIALTASADHDGYFVYTGGSLQVYGGTSVPTPSFAGVTALLNQYLGSKGLGNINPKLYSLAQSTSGVFHDITVGNNIVTVGCGRRAISCSATAVGYNAGPGYDLASGLGSVDAYNLAVAWSGGTVVQPPPPTETVTLVSSLNPAGFSDTVYLVATVTNSTGITPAGAVTFTIGGNSLGSANLVGSAGTANATLAVTGAPLSQGSGVVQASFSGASASLTVSVQNGSRSSGTSPAISGVTNGASFHSTFSPGMIMSVFGSQLAPSAQAASSVPLAFSMNGVAATVNGAAAPLFYVSPGQINLQIPFETATNSNALLSINNNGKIVTSSFAVTAVAPGIFVNSSSAPVPSTSAVRGQTITLFITGSGTVTPAVADGNGPSASTALANLPSPAQKTSVTVGGVNAPIEFIGDPAGLVGVIQINYTVPASISTGNQPVVVTVGGVASAAASLAVTK
jgi:uncharacterized protein (TIGR03437 family)